MNLTTTIIQAQETENEFFKAIAVKIGDSTHIYFIRKEDDSIAKISSCLKSQVEIEAVINTFMKNDKNR